MLNLESFERINERECWAKYGWGCEAKQNTDILHGFMNGYEVFCDEMNDAYSEDGKPCFGCEVYDHDGDMVGQWFAEDIDSAIRGAFIEAVGMETMREEGNCEDSVNVITSKVRDIMFGEHAMFEWLQDECLFEQSNELMAAAREYVKANCARAGFEWEEF